MNCGFCLQYPFIDQDAGLSITIIPIGCYILLSEVKDLVVRMEYM